MKALPFTLYSINYERALINILSITWFDFYKKKENNV